jgi:urea transporter/murein DD-endopeptidase MepM/ murein hydrolase activator NlpD
MERNKLNLKDFLLAVLNSYSQVFFSRSKVLAIILLIISFFDYGAGIAGLIAVIISSLLPFFLGYNKYYLNSGLYGFNSLLAGLGIGLFFQPSPELFLLVGIAAVTCFFLTIVFQGVLGKYGLPYLSVPFLFTIWIVALSGPSLTALNISCRTIYVQNELYALGGKLFVDLYDYLESSIGSSFLKVYFHSLGAIFFQNHLLAGIIISAGLLIYSRISFVLSLLGFSVAYLFYRITGIEFNSVGYAYIGFNYILTAIALGGYYLIPGRVSFGWTILLLPAVVLITISTQQVFMLVKTSPYSLPFNIVVLMFLYALKLREQRPKNLIETPVQMGNPENNLYLYSGNSKRFPAAFPVSASLPFYGEWTVSQGHNDELTHKDAWRHAWDFIITDRNGKQFKGSGDIAEDYFCFGKAILATYDGTVAEVINHIHDNKIGEVNTRENWGNTVVIKHSEYLYSKVCHLMNKSVLVKVGDQVKKGQAIAKCGNSGRSPFPHLHFQFQATPYIGSSTISYPVGHYLLKEINNHSFKTFDFPAKNQVVANTPKNESLEKAMHFVPGQKLSVSFIKESLVTKQKSEESVFTWIVETDVYNTTFIRSESDGAVAYLYNNRDLHYFTNFVGNRNSALFWFFLAFYKVPLGFLPQTVIKDNIPVNLMFRGFIKLIQDLAAPLYIFLTANYELNIVGSGDILSGGGTVMNVLITKKIAGRLIGKIRTSIKFTGEECFEIITETKETKIKMVCRGKQD